MDKTSYICPMHSEVVQNRPGRCPKCGMELVKKGSTSNRVDSSLNNYMPLIIIIGLILLTAVAIDFREFSLKNIIYNFMAGFFLVFAGFKLIDIKGFAQGYSTYDLLAKRWFSYGYIYPFIELFFGLSMIVGFQIQNVLLAELIVMSFSGLGVLTKLLKKEKFQCVCLGTFLKVPLTKVTLVEDFGMAILAAVMLKY